MAPYQGPRGQDTQGLRHKRLGIQLPPDQERAFWREEIRKVVTYWNAAPGEEEPDTQARVLAPDHQALVWVPADLIEVGRVPGSQARERAWFQFGLQFNAVLCRARRTDQGCCQPPGRMASGATLPVHRARGRRRRWQGLETRWQAREAAATCGCRTPTESR
jgi:hypothetical protein